MTDLHRYERLMRDLDRGHSDERIAARTGYSVGYVRAARSTWNKAWWAARRAKRMTPRSGAVEQGVGTLSDAEPTQLTGQISGG